MPQLRGKSEEEFKLGTLGTLGTQEQLGALGTG